MSRESISKMMRATELNYAEVTIVSRRRKAAANVEVAIK